MRTHTNDFKTNIAQIGRQLDSKITYQDNGSTIELGSEILNSVTPHYKGDILKSVMKQLDIDSNVDIPVGTIVNYQFGVKVNKYYETEDETYQVDVDYYSYSNDIYTLLIVGTDYDIGDLITGTIYNYQEYEYIDFGNYIVNKSEEQKDTNSYKLTCYDKMLYSMVDYEDIGITYPITIRNYINTVCTHLGITFANSGDTFTNYDKEIPSELFLDSEGKSLGYTFRDVLDQLAQVTASTICINDDDELEIRYITNTNDTIDEEFLKNVNVEFGKKYGPVNSVVLSRSAGADNIYEQDDESITLNGLCELKIEDNQILNGNSRDEFLPGIFNQLNGLEYYINDFSSTGITYYDLCDRYTLTIDNNNYSCVMLNDEILITQGLQENVHTDMPLTNETEYKYADKTDKKINQAYLIVDKVNGEITSVVSRVNEVEVQESNNYQEIISKFDNYAPKGDIVSLQTSVTQLQTDTYTKTQIDTKLVDGSVEKVKTTLVTIDNDGTTWDKNDSNVKTNVDADGLEIIDKTGSSQDVLLEAKYDSSLGETIVRTKRLKVDKYFVMGTHSRFEDYESGTGCFYI